MNNMTLNFKIDLNLIPVVGETFFEFSRLFMFIFPQMRQFQFKLIPKDLVASIGYLTILLTHFFIQPKKKNPITFCMLGNFSCLFFSISAFSTNFTFFSKKHFRTTTISVKKFGSITLRCSKH